MHFQPCVSVIEFHYNDQRFAAAKFRVFPDACKDSFLKVCAV